MRKMMPLRHGSTRGSSDAVQCNATTFLALGYIKGAKKEVIWMMT